MSRDSDQPTASSTSTLSTSATISSSGPNGLSSSPNQMDILIHDRRRILRKFIEEKVDVKAIQVLMNYGLSIEQIVHPEELYSATLNSSTARDVPIDRMTSTRTNLFAKDHTTFLHIAAAVDNSEAVSLLLKLGHPLNVRDFRGDSPLHIAAEKRYSETVAIMLEHVRTLPREEKLAFINLQNNNGETVLHLKLAATDLNLLVMEGADVNIPNFSSKSTPLHRHVSLENRDQIKVLVANGASPLVLNNHETPELPYEVSIAQQTKNEIKDYTILCLSKLCVLSGTPTSSTVNPGNLRKSSTNEDLFNTFLRLCTAATFRNLQDAAHLLLDHPKVKVSHYDLFQQPVYVRKSSFPTGNLPLFWKLKETITIETECRFLIGQTWRTQVNMGNLERTHADFNVSPKEGTLVFGFHATSFSVDVELELKREGPLVHTFTLSLSGPRDTPTYLFYFRIRVCGESVGVNVEEFDRSRLEHQQYLAQGAYSVVRLMLLDDKDKVVMKTYSQPRLAVQGSSPLNDSDGDGGSTPLTRDSVFELNSLQRLRHPNIVSLIGKVLNPLAAVLELVPEGTLGDAIWKKQLGEEGEKEGLKLKIAWEIASALEYIHSEDIVHRDVKPDNVLILSLSEDSKIHIKLCDFGCAMWIGEICPRVPVGTPFFMAPELFDGTGELGPGLDIFSLGMLLWCLWALSTHWKSISNEDLEEIRSGNRRPRVNPKWDPIVKSVITSSWNHLPSNRLSSQAVQENLKFAVAQSS
eukprot:TRINITY_DN5601_c0_g2_i1.p1 TRINITY_DN5601_c0_g2~~TRINITY_DN5601_c0_g2_i1.p1  ORF type:complete len:751 (+),score=127.48 TRINITY_DN5601_c0_g2_i1:113-2365(+)